MVLDWLPLDWVTGIIAVVTLTYLYLTLNYNHWKKKGIQYEKPVPLFGNYKDVIFGKKAVGTLVHEIYRKFEGHPYVGLFRFQTPALLIRDPEIVKTILVKQFSSFSKNGFPINPEMDPLFARSPFFIMGKPWKSARTMLSPSFTSGKLKPLFPLIEKVGEDLDKYLERHSSDCGPDGIEAKDLCSKFTIDVVSSCAFGVEAKCLQDTKSEFEEMNKRVFNQDFLTNLRFLVIIMTPTLGNLMKLRFMPLEVANFYRRIIKEVMTYRENNNQTRNDFLQMLMQLKVKGLGNSTDEVYDDEDITGHAVTFVTDGFETSSIAMSFFLYELAMHPDAQARLREEIEEAVRNNDGKLTYDLVNSLPYLSMALAEALRMHPPLMTLEKFCTQPCDLSNESGKTLQVEPGTLILISAHALQHDPQYYPEPDKFDPERFSDERKDSIPKFAYLPFGEGPRICIGMRFAQLQMKVGIAHVLLNYDVRPTAKTPKTIVQDERYFLAGAKGGLWLEFVRRH